MTSFIRKIFNPPQFEDEEITHKVYFLNIIVWVLIFFPLIYFLYILIIVPADISRTLMQGAFAEIVNGIILYLIHHRQIRAATLVQIGGLWIFFTVSAVTGAGVRGESYLLGYPLVIMIAGILKNRRVAIGITMLSLATGWGMAYAEIHGHFIPTNVSNPMATWVISLAIFPLGAVLQTLAKQKLQNALQRASKSEERYKLISRVSSDYTFASDVNEHGQAKLIWVAGAFEKMTGYTFEEYKASGEWLAHVHPDDLEKDAQDMEKLRKNQDIANSDIRTFTKSGKIRWERIFAHPIWSEEEKRLIRILGAVQDVTEQKIATELEQNRRAMLGNIIKLGQVVTEAGNIDTTLEKIWHGVHEVLQFDRLAIFLYNPERNSMDRALGTNNQGQMDKTPGVSFPLEKRTTFSKVLEKPDGLYFSHNYGVEDNRMEGDDMYGVKDFAAIAVWAGEKPVAVICVDRLLTGLPISDLQLEALRLFAGYAGLAIENARLNTVLQNELSQRQETLLHQSAILNGIPDMAWLKDKNSRYVAVNEQFAKTAGMKMEEIVGKTDFEIWHESFAEKYRNDDLEVMQSHQRKQHIEELQVDSTGREYWVETTKTPILNASGEVIGTVGIAHEVTKRKKAELERENLITELEAKNAELERYTYTVSHDLKSPLVTIRGFLGYLEKDTLAGNSQKIKDDMKRIEDAAKKMQALLNDLLELSRIGRLMNQPTDTLFTDIVKDAIDLVRGQIDSKGNLSIEICCPPLIVHGDRTRLTEVIQNLVDNAIKFMGDQPKPQITIGSVTNEQNEIIFFVRDNGIGIERQYHDRIFTLFNKLNTDTEGTGIGLTLVKRIIEVHKGRIWLESEPGKGTTFYFTLS